MRVRVSVAVVACAGLLLAACSAGTSAGSQDSKPVEDSGGVAGERLAEAPSASASGDPDQGFLNQEDVVTMVVTNYSPFVIPYKGFDGFAVDHPRRDLRPGESDVLQSYYWDYRPPLDPEADLFFGEIKIRAHNPTIGYPTLTVFDGTNLQKHGFSEGERCYMRNGDLFYALERAGDTTDADGGESKYFNVHIKNARPADRPEC